MTRLLDWIDDDLDEADDWHWYQEPDLLAAVLFAIGGGIVALILVFTFASAPKSLCNWGIIDRDARIESVTLCEGNTAVETVTPDRRIAAEVVEWDMFGDTLKNTDVEVDEDWQSLSSDNTARTYTVALGNAGSRASEVFVLDAGHAWVDGKGYLLLDDGELYKKCAALFTGDSNQKRDR